MSNDDRSTSRLVALENSVHPLPAGSRVLRRTSGRRWLELTLAVKRRHVLPDLSSLERQKPAQRHYLTREQLATTYGPDPKAVAAIERFAQAHGLVITRREPAAARLGIGGTVAALSAAFGVTLFDYSHPTLGEFHARTGPVQLPAALAQAITGVFGFNNQRVLRRKRVPSRHPADLAVPNR